MIYLVEIKVEARKDIINAAAWYRARQEGFDNIFLSAVEATIYRILANPHAGTNFYKTFGETNIKKFPYVIVYEIFSDSIVIYEVFHTSQNPKKKIKRLK